MLTKKIPPAGYREVVTQSPMPALSAAAAAAAYVLSFPLYTPAHLLPPLAGAAGVYTLLRVLLPKQISYVPAQPAETGLDRADMLLSEGRRLVDSLRQAGEAVRGSGISVQLFRIEDACKKIFAHVERYPRKEKELRAFLNYYLPTAVRLAGSYAEFASSGAAGKNTRAAMARIEKTLDKMGAAFENQLDALYGDRTMDVTADIAVLDTMLKTHGLI